MEYQAAKALRNWKNQLEYSIINSGVASGSSGVGRTMAGIINIVTSHYTNRNSGTSLSETEFNAMVYDVANDVGTNDVFDLVVTTLQLRQKISTFTAGTTRYVDASDKKLIRPVMVYESKITKIGLIKFIYMLENLKALNTGMDYDIMKVNGQFIIQLQFQGCNNRQSAGKTLLVVRGNTGWGGELLRKQTLSKRNKWETCDSCGGKRSQFPQKHNCSMRQVNKIHGNNTDQSLQRGTGNTQNILCTSGSREQETGTVPSQSNSLCNNKKSASSNSIRVCTKQGRSGNKVLPQCSLYPKGNRIGRYGEKIERVKNPQRLHDKLLKGDDIVRSCTKVQVNNKMDFGVHRVFGHKDVPKASATPGPALLGLKEDKWRVSYLRPPVREMLAKDGDRENGQIVGEATIEFLAERANAYRSGFNQTG